MLVISGRVKDGITLNEAENEVEVIIQNLKENPFDEQELIKVKNQAESMLEFGEVEVINRAMNLAFAKLSGDAGLVNAEAARIESIRPEDIQRVSNQILREENSNVLYYQSLKN